MTFGATPPPTMRQTPAMNRIALLLLLCMAQIAGAAPTREWFAIRLDGERIGHVERDRTLVGDEVHSREYFRARFNRNGVPLTVTSEEKHRERRDGTPVGFSYRQKLGASETRLVGELLDARTLRVRVRFGESSTQRRVAWPEGALLAEGVRLREQSLPRTPGSLVRYRSFNPAALEGLDTEARVIGMERIRVGGTPMEALRVEHWLSFGSGGVRVVAHVDADGRLLRTTMPLFGRELLIERGSAADAVPPKVRADVYDFTLVASPVAIDAALRRRDLDYTLRLGRGDEGAGLPIAQQEWRGGKRGELDVRVQAEAGPAREAVPTAPEYLAATLWINADAPAIRRFAERAAQGVDDDIARMLRLEQAVRERISNKSLRVGYASALDAYTRREGDCSEHALLLAAAARSLGIPTRIAIGLVYADRFGRHRQVFVPHAWVQARVAGRWQNFDAAQDGFGSDHLALALGSGEPSGYYGSLERIAALRIERIAPAPP